MDHWPPLSNVDVKRRRVIVPDTNHLEWIDVHVERVVAAIRLVAINLNLVFVSMWGNGRMGGFSLVRRRYLILIYMHRLDAGRGYTRHQYWVRRGQV